MACEKGRQYSYGWVNWTVGQETPDLVYYQSFLAYGIGWKIHVLDEGEEPSSVDKIKFEHTAFMSTILTICLFSYFFS